MLPSSGTTSTFDLSEVGYVKRIVVGSVDPQRIPSQEELEKQMALVNRCLSEPPKGKLLGMERSFSILRVAEHQVVLEAVAYHIGFKRTPYWLVEEEQKKGAKPKFDIDPDKINRIIDQQ